MNDKPIVVVRFNDNIVSKQLSVSDKHNIIKHVLNHKVSHRRLMTRIGDIIAKEKLGVITIICSDHEVSVNVTFVRLHTHNYKLAYDIKNKFIDDCNSIIELKEDFKLHLFNVSYAKCKNAIVHRVTEDMYTLIGTHMDINEKGHFLKALSLGPLWMYENFYVGKYSNNDSNLVDSFTVLVAVLDEYDKEEDKVSIMCSYVAISSVRVDINASVIKDSLLYKIMLMNIQLVDILKDKNDAYTCHTCIR